MEQNNNLNIEEIMSQIKKDIEVKGYTNDLLSFDDVIVDVSSMNVNKFDKVKFNEDLYVANHEWEVNPYRPIQGNKVTVFIKKAIRKTKRRFFVFNLMFSTIDINANDV